MSPNKNSAEQNEQLVNFEWPSDDRFILLKLGYSFRELREIPTLKEKEVEIKRDIHIQNIQEYTWCKESSG